MNVLPRYTPGSTNANPVIDSYDSLAQRIRRQLGEPLVNVEISNEQIYDNIAIAMEYFTKYAGYTEEFLLFDSRIQHSAVPCTISAEHPRFTIATKLFLRP